MNHIVTVKNAWERERKKERERERKRERVRERAREYPKSSPPPRKSPKTHKKYKKIHQISPHICDSPSPKTRSLEFTLVWVWGWERERTKERKTYCHIQIERHADKHTTKSNNQCKPIINSSEIQRWYKDDTKMIQRWYKDDTKMIQRWYKDDTKMIPFGPLIVTVRSPAPASLRVHSEPALVDTQHTWHYSRTEHPYLARVGRPRNFYSKRTAWKIRIKASSTALFGHIYPGKIDL